MKLIPVCNTLTYSTIYSGNITLVFFLLEKGRCTYILGNVDISGTRFFVIYHLNGNHNSYIMGNVVVWFSLVLRYLHRIQTYNMEMNVFVRLCGTEKFHRWYVFNKFFVPIISKIFWRHGDMLILNNIAVSTNLCWRNLGCSSSSSSGLLKYFCINM